MSKTDKTKPLRVRVAEHRLWEIHDHIDGICDLPEDPRDNDWRGCHYRDWERFYKGNCCYGCCTSCHESYELRRIRRRDRHTAKAALRRGDWDSLSSKSGKNVW